jgi:hypothetical protein
MLPLAVNPVAPAVTPAAGQPRVPDIPVLTMPDRRALGIPETIVRPLPEQPAVFPNVVQHLAPPAMGPVPVRPNIDRGAVLAEFRMALARIYEAAMRPQNEPAPDRSTAEEGPQIELVPDRGTAAGERSRIEPAPDRGIAVEGPQIEPARGTALERPQNEPAHDLGIAMERPQIEPAADPGIAAERPRNQPAPDHDIAAERPRNQPAPDHNIAAERPRNQPAPDHDIAAERPRIQPVPDHGIAVERPRNQPAPDRGIAVERPWNQPAPDRGIAVERPGNQPAPDRGTAGAATRHQTEPAPDRGGIAEAAMRPVPERVPGVSRVNHETVLPAEGEEEGEREEEIWLREKLVELRLLFPDISPDWLNSKIEGRYPVLEIESTVRIP